MDKGVARALWQFANNRRAMEFHKLVNMLSCAKEADVEAQRMRVAAWATAAQELYAAAHREEQAV